MAVHDRISETHVLERGRRDSDLAILHWRTLCGVGGVSTLKQEGTNQISPTSGWWISSLTRRIHNRGVLWLLARLGWGRIRAIDLLKRQSVQEVNKPLRLGGLRMPKPEHGVGNRAPQSHHKDSSKDVWIQLSIIHRITSFLYAPEPADEADGEAAAYPVR